MNNEPNPFNRLLIPVDSSEAFGRLAPLAGLLIRTMHDAVADIDLLHVISGAYLGEHMSKLNLAAGEKPALEVLMQLRSRHLDGTVTPLLSESNAILQQLSDGRRVGTILKDGDPIKVITAVCRQKPYSTLIMNRRNLAERAGKLTGSVVGGILHRLSEATIYLCGDQPIAEDVSPFARCLIGVDGSPASRNAVAEAGMLLSRVNEQIEKIFLVHVLDQSCYYEEDGIPCMELGSTGQQALEESATKLIEAGIDPEKITTVIHFGLPGTVLAEEVVGCDATLIFIGRRDRSRMAQVYLGSVCTDIVQNCRERTLVLAS